MWSFLPSMESGTLSFWSPTTWTSRTVLSFSKAISHRPCTDNNLGDAGILVLADALMRIHSLRLLNLSGQPLSSAPPKLIFLPSIFISAPFICFHEVVFGVGFFWRHWRFHHSGVIPSLFPWNMIPLKWSHIRSFHNVSPSLPGNLHRPPRPRGSEYVLLFVFPKYGLFSVMLFTLRTCYFVSWGSQTLLFYYCQTMPGV